MKPITIAALAIGAVAAKVWLFPNPDETSAITSAAYSAQFSEAPAVSVDVFSIRRGSAAIKIRNISDARLSSVFLQCTFRNGYGERIDSVPILVSNLAAGDAANEIARMPNDIKADTVACRTEHAYKD